MINIDMSSPVDNLIKNELAAKYNSLGHYSKEIKDIDLENHFIIVGDQAGLCDNMHIRDTFFYKTSNLLNIDYYNLCVRHGGLDAVKHNLLTWIWRIGTPKAIVIAWENPNNFLYFNSKDKNYQPANYILDRRDYKELINYASREFKDQEGSGGFFGSRTFLFKHLLRHTIKIPIVELSWGDPTHKAVKSAMHIDCRGISTDHKRLTRVLCQKIRKGIRVSN